MAHIKKYKSRKDFIKEEGYLYKTLSKKNPELLNKVFGRPGDESRFKLDNFYKKNNRRPKKGEELYSVDQAQFNNNANWSQSMKIKYPFLLSRKEKDFKKMNDLMPKSMSLISGQEWKTFGDYYNFFDKKWGKFKAKPSRLMCRSWPYGRCGHPKEGIVSSEKAKNKSIVNLDTNEVFSSFKEARLSTKVKCNLHRAIKEKKTAGGYRWAYYNKKIHG